MELRRSSHAVYDLKYHLVWVPKYRADIMRGEIAEYLKVVFQRIAEEYEFEIDTNGSNGRPCACVYHCPAKVYTIATCTDTEEYQCQRIVQEVPGPAQGDVELEDFEKP